jgi:gas vesicle protein
MDFSGARLPPGGTDGGDGGTFQMNSVSARAQAALAKTWKVGQEKVGQEKTMANNEGGANGLGWFLAGLGVGALIGVLYAPKAGKETREDLANAARDAKEKAEELVEQGKQKANEYVEQGKQYVEQGKQKAAELVEEGKRQAKDSVDKGREYYEKGRTQWTQYVEKGKSLVNEQQAKVGAAVDAGTEAYVNTTVETPV